MKLTSPPTTNPTIYDRNPLGIISADARTYAAHEMGTLFSYTVPNNRLANITIVQLEIARLTPSGKFDMVHLWVGGTISGNYKIIADVYLSDFNPLYEKGLIITPNLLLKSGDIIDVELGAGMPQDDFRLNYSLVITEFDA